MLYGAVVGLLMHLVVVEIFDLIQHPTNNNLSTIQKIILNLFPDDDSLLTTKKFLYPTMVVLSWNVFTFALTLVCYFVGAEQRYFRYLCRIPEIVACLTSWCIFAVLHDHEDKISHFFKRRVKHGKGE